MEADSLQLPSGFAYEFKIVSFDSAHYHGELVADLVLKISTQLRTPTSLIRDTGMARKWRIPYSAVNKGDAYHVSSVKAKKGSR